MIKNKIYEYQKFEWKNPIVNEITIVWVKRIAPIEIGCVRQIRVIDEIKVIIIRNIMIQRIV